MSDKDRDAFEKWAFDNHHGTSRNANTGFYNSAETAWAYDAWQAARDQYAPKLTEAEAVKTAARAIYDSNREKYWPVNFQEASAAIQISITQAAKAALRAAGVRWKEEA
jgi:hypothetical protein